MAGSAASCYLPPGLFFKIGLICFPPNWAEARRWSHVPLSLWRWLERVVGQAPWALWLSPWDFLVALVPQLSGGWRGDGTIAARLQTRDLTCRCRRVDSGEAVLVLRPAAGRGVLECCPVTAIEGPAPPIWCPSEIDIYFGRYSLDAPVTTNVVFVYDFTSGPLCLRTDVNIVS